MLLRQIFTLGFGRKVYEFLDRSRPEMWNTSKISSCQSYDDTRKDQGSNVKQFDSYWLLL